MEFTRRYLPMEWEERWRKEKERRKSLIAEGGEGAEQVNQELRRIVAYNDSRMGLLGGTGNIEKSENRGIQEHGSKNAFEYEGFGDDVRMYHNDVSSREVFRTLKDIWDSSVLTDLTLATDNGSTLHVHSPVLAAVSSLVLEKLRSSEEERSPANKDAGFQRWSVSLGSEVDHIGLQAVVEFAYTGGVSSLNKDTTAHIEAAAEILGVSRVLDLCKREESRKEDVGSSMNEAAKISAQEEMKITFQSIERLWANRVGCDVALDVDGTLFHVHRVILAASSDYFRGMFTCGMRESQQVCVALSFLSVPELDALIGHAYRGTLPLTWDCVFEIACTALQLQFQPALSLCLAFMRQEMEATWCLDVASFAKAYGIRALIEEANDFVLRNFWEVSSTAKFQDLPAEELLDFLRHDGLCAPSELAVFRAVISWIEADPDKRLSQAALLMTAVRFPLMTFREFREVRAINLQMECLGSKEIDLYGSALKEFGFSLQQTQQHWRIRQPKDALVVVGGDQLSTDTGHRIPSKEVWFANSIRSGTGLVKEVEWRRLGEIPVEPKFRHGVAAMDGQLYVFGGCYFYAKDDIMKSAYSYDPEQDSWRRLADMQESRSNFSVVAQEGRLYAIGGDKEINTNIASVEMYNPDTDSWSFVQPLDQTLSGFAATAVNGGIFISGGFDCKYVCLASTFLYHPRTGTTKMAAMAHDRAQHCMEAVRGCLYVGGGMCNLRAFYTDQRACEVYDPAADTWAALPPLPVPHVGGASAVLEEKVYILGGYCQEDYSESGLVHRFDPSMHKWERVGKLPAAVADIRACSLRLPERFRH